MDELDLHHNTLNVQEGCLDQVIGFLRAHDIPSDPHICTPRLVVETKKTTIEITAADDAVEIREVQDGTRD